MNTEIKFIEIRWRGSLHKPVHYIWVLKCHLGKVWANVRNRYATSHLPDTLLPFHTPFAHSLYFSQRMLVTGHLMGHNLVEKQLTTLLRYGNMSMSIPSPNNTYPGVWANRMKWVRHTQHTRRKWKICDKFLSLNLKEGRPWCRWKDNGSKRKGMWNGFSQLKIKLQAWTPVNSVMKLPYSTKGKSDNSWFTEGLSNDTVSSSGYIKEVKK
jgi:hypothetical protein